MNSLAGRLSVLEQERGHLAAAGINPFGVCIDEVTSATEALIAGRPTLLLGTNNYLGLSFAPEAIAAAVEATQRMGTGTTGSRVANGTYGLHQRLEQRIAALYDRPEALVFSTGYMANLGVLSTVAGPGDTILLDADSHACIYDGCRLSGATVVRFRHNDVADLEKRIRRLPKDRAGGLVIVVEGVYSMLGDRAPLREIVEVKKRCGAMLVVDEAHSLGVFGARGRGLAEEVGVLDDVDFLVATFSKSVGTIGGFCVSSQAGLDFLRYTSRPYVFSASLPPSVVAAALASVDLMEAGTDLRERLWRNVTWLHEALTGLGLEILAAESPILAVRMPSEAALLSAWVALLERGVYVNLALPPATPQGVYLLRCSVCAVHTREQLERVRDVFRQIAEGLRQP
jgi:8-amino-7-oxononanoate synthase